MAGALGAAIEDLATARLRTPMSVLPPIERMPLPPGPRAEPLASLVDEVTHPHIAFIISAFPPIKLRLGGRRGHGPTTRRLKLRTQILFEHPKENRGLGSGNGGVAERNGFRFKCRFVTATTESVPMRQVDDIRTDSATTDSSFEEQSSVIHFDPAKALRGIVHHVLEEIPNSRIDQPSVVATMRRLEQEGWSLFTPRSAWAALTNQERLKCLLSTSGAVLMFDRSGVTRVVLAPEKT